MNSVVAMKCFITSLDVHVLSPKMMFILIRAGHGIQAHRVTIFQRFVLPICTLEVRGQLLP